MRNARRLLAALLAVVMLIPSILVPGYAAETTGFKDVREDSWYANAVDYVSAAGYMKGTSKDAFSPGEDVTRAMFVTILSRVARAQTDNTVSAFGDVAANQYYSGAIEWAAEKEIVNGVGGGLFAPYRSITRQDLAVMLYRFVNAMGYELSAGESRTYTDEAAISAYAADAVRFVTSTGLFAGYQDGSFRPKATATRAQTAVIVMRLAQLLDGQIVDPEPMPAQSFDQTSEQMQVSVNAPEGALPENTRMTVSRVTDEAALAELASKVGAEVLGAADISFAKDGAELEPARKVNVRISLDALQSAKNPAVVHVKDDGSFEYVSSSVVTTRGKADAIEFEADSFSVYAVLDENTNATLTISFYARRNGSEGNWQIVNKQIIRADQLGAGKSAIADPGVPNITTSQAFEGWALEGENVPFNENFTVTADTTTYSVRQINDYCNETPLAQNREVVLYAAVYDVVYVTYHDQAGAVTSAEYHKIPAGSNSVSVTITEDYPPMKSNQNFSGWVKEDMIDRRGNVDGTLPTYKEGAGASKWPVGSTQNISENVDLYPYVEEGYWLSFNNNIAKNSQKLGFEDDTSAEYISPKFIPNGTTPTQPAFPSNDPRHGYTFVGWYKDADMTTAFTFNQPLTEDTTVYAKWAFATTSYRVVYWKQRATDDYTYNDSQKNFDYFGSRTVTGATTGSIVGISSSGTNNDTTVNVAQNNENNFYFRFNSSKSDKTVANGSTVKVKGDGTTVLNVYYDRKTITYNFGPAELHYYQTTPDWNNPPYVYYARTNGVYVEVYRLPSGSSYVYYMEYTGTVSTSGSYYMLMNNSFCPLSYDYSYGWRIYYEGYYYDTSASDNGKVYTSYTYAPVSTWYEPRYEMGSVTYTHSNLYGHLYNESDWPSAGSGNTWSCNDISNGEVYQFPLALTEYVPTWRNQSNPTNSYLTMNFYVSEYSTNTIPVRYVGESKTNSSLYNVALTSGTASKDGTWYPTETVEGFTIKGYAFLSSAPTSSTTWTNCTETSEIPVGASETRTLYVAFTRNNYTLTYSSTNNVGTQTEDVTIPYEKSLTSYKSHTPANSYPGYYFAGWYLDEDGTKPFDLETMPARNVIVYAKWNPKWYRIVVDYKRGNSSSVITVPGSTQKASFTVQYGSTILTSSLMQAQRMDLDGNDNWMLVGLYLDEACTQPFNQNMHAPFGLTEEQEVYPAGSRTGIDDITGETWSDEAYPDVRAKITLYAKWRVNPEGVVGIKVRYLGDHAENDKGYFDSNEKPHSMTLQNPVFTDGAKASAHSATVPALPDEDTPDVGRRFLYWEILDKYGNPTGEIVYPGSPFTIDINKAVEIKTPLPDPNCTHTNEGASTIASVAAVAPTCTGTGVAAHYKCTKCGRLFTDAAGTTETTLDALTVPATGHDWATNAPTYVWSVVTFDEYTVPTCTATVVCGNDETHVETETVTGQLVVNGTTGHYLAEFENPAFADQQSGTFTVSRIAVTYQANGEIIDELTQLVTSGQTVTLPGSEYLPAFTGYTFVGWVQAAVSDTTNAPAYKAPGATSDPINGPTTFIALYTREQATGGNTTVYKRLTESPADWTGRYVITEGNTDELHALKTCGSGLYLQVADGAATLSDSGMTLIDSNTLSGPASDYLFNVSAVSTTSPYYYIRNAKDNGYVSVYQVDSSTYYLYSSTSGTYRRWSLSMNGESVVAQNYSYTSYYLAYGVTTDNVFIFAAMTAAPFALYFWKETTVPATQTHYTTTIPTYTVTYSVPSGVDQPDPETVVQGESLTLPAAPEGTPSGYTFLGWTTAQTGNATTQPATLTGEYTPVGTVTLYALYSYVQGSGSVEYNLVTAAPADWSGSYVITNNSTTTKYVLKGVTGSASGTNAESAANRSTLSASGITQNGNVLTNVADAYVFTLTANGSYYTVKSASTGSYYGQNSDSLLFAYSALNGNKTNWTPAINASGAAQLKCAANGSFPYFGFNTSGNYFWAASSNNANVLQLWKQTPVGTTYYTTNPGNGGNAVTQPNLSSDKADSSANLINLSANAIPNPNPLGAGDVWVPTTTIDTSKEYLIGISDGSNVYLLANHNGSSNYYTLNSNYKYLYTGTATLDGNNVIGVTGAQTSLDNCKWKFGSSTGGVITNQNNTRYKLRFATSGASSGTITFYQLFQSSTNSSSTTYDSSSNTIRFGDYYLGLVSINGVDYGCVLDSQPTTSVILYTKATNYTVTVASGITNGSVSASPTTAAAGATITLAVSPNTGYEIGTVTYTPAGGSAVTISPVNGVYSFQMPAANVTVSATFTASATPEPGITTIERWVPVNNVENGEDYLIGFVLDGTTYLGLNYSPNTTSHYYYSFKFYTDNIQSSRSSYLGYTGTPIFDGVNITGVEGNTTNLEHATWTFNATNGGYYVVSKNNSNRYLYAMKGGSSSSGTNSYYWDQYPRTTANVWTWDATNHHLYNTTNSVYAGVFTLSNGVYMSCEAANDPNYTDYIYVQLYKKEIINVYNVTVNPAENGTVRANKSTATAGETVKLTLTPSEGYQVASVTVTDSNGATVPVTGTSGSFTFTMPASNVTVSATFTNVIPDNVWVVSFVDEDGKDIPGMNDIYVPKNTPDNLPESALPDPAKEEHYFLGWYQGDVKCTFPMTVNSDIVLTPKYSPMYAYDYTLTLRAVYGPYNPDATTHIYWYANNGTDAHNGAGERYTSKYTVTEGGMTTTTTKLPINAQVDIPLPTGNAASQTVFVGDNGGALTWEDHVFLGWARVDNGGTADAAEAQILTPDDIYLKWTGTEYVVRNDDGTYSPFSSQKVYADETTPYHDMYAVWAGFYYIYHSSDGSLEAVQVPYDVRDTKDLVAEAESKGCLYGGYYRTSGAVVSVDAAEMRTAKDSILNAQNFWNYTDSCVASGSVTETSLTDEGAVVYNGTSIKHTVDHVTVPFWQKAQAYTELGTELAPTAGTVYYLKEVPKTFLPNRLVYVKADKNTQLYDGTPIEEGELTSLYLLTAVDDMNYSANGFMVGTAHTGQNVSTPDANSGPADTVSRVFTIFVKNGVTYSYNANALNPSIVVPEGMNPNLVGFVAAKHLDYDWIQAHRGQTTDTATFYLKPYWTTLDGVTVTQDNIKGVNITADGKGISFVNVQ